ncbi:MAG: EF2563 family selenium-dependent molybdenum hydroxylase system protein [Deltaproteobacteria bacterium]|nr:EF2563 family selenium-dependent molybdenum hydroxylase system protein [Deltaproteobacteria bacterium]MBW2138029.1 EF2563 family selenium-dependent molybdenum hydroxylase system protein [Deltaproteobacteria bacterium]
MEHEPVKGHLGLPDIRVLLKGGGEMASGVAWRLYQCGFRVCITETDHPIAVRRKVSFCEAVYDGHARVEGVDALLARDVAEALEVWEDRKIPVLVDPECEALSLLNPDVLVDAIIAKRNTGTSIVDAPLVIALGPGFEAGEDAHYVVETNRGHNLGKLLTSGCAEANTGIPGSMLGITTDRVLRAPGSGHFRNHFDIGDLVKKGDIIGRVGDIPVEGKIDGVLRGLIRPGIEVRKGLKIGDIDPRGVKEYCFTISEKARAIGGAVVEGILRRYGR